jgi:hypothetical protein
MGHNFPCWTLRIWRCRRARRVFGFWIICHPYPFSVVSRLCVSRAEPDIRTTYQHTQCTHDLLVHSVDILASENRTVANHELKQLCCTECMYSFLAASARVATAGPAWDVHHCFRDLWTRCCQACHRRLSAPHFQLRPHCAQWGSGMG